MGGARPWSLGGKAPSAQKATRPRRSARKRPFTGTDPDGRAIGPAQDPTVRVIPKDDPAAGEGD